VDRRWLTAWLKGRGDTTTTVDEREWGAISASMGMQWMILDSWNVLVNAGLSWRPPQVNELYANDVHHGAARYEVGDPELDRERALGIDVTSRHAVRGFEAEATLHLTHFDKYIQAVPDAENPTVTVRGTFPTYQFVQTDAVIVGVDLSSTLDLSDIISLYVNGSMVRGTDLGRNVPLFLMPADRLRVGAHLHLHDVLDIHDVHVDLSLLGVRTQDRYVVDEDYAPPPPGYVIADLSVGGRVSIAGRDARLSISIRNVLDRPYRDYLSQYRYFADDPGRDIILRFTIPFGDL
jgi:iron complex outermembrane recepter protein